MAVGGMVALEAMFAGPITGASMKPARSLAPALASATWQHLWIDLIAPFLGTAAAVLSCRLLRDEGCCMQDASSEGCPTIELERSNTHCASGHTKGAWRFQATAP